MPRKTRSKILILASGAGFSLLALSAGYTQPEATRGWQIQSQPVVAANAQLDCFKNALKNYSGYDLAQPGADVTNLLLDNLIQFSDGPTLSASMLVVNITKAEFVKRFFISFNVTNNESALGAEADVTLFYRTAAGVVDSKQAQLSNLKPKVIWDLHLVNDQYDMKQSQQFGFFSAYEFSARFNDNLPKLINFWQENQLAQPLVTTNIKRSDFTKFKPVIKMGIVDNIAGTITNNTISFLVPSVNVGTPDWSTGEDHFAVVTYRFSLSNFAPQAVAIQAQPDGIFDVRQNPKLQNLTADNFNEEVFLQHLVQYNSTFLNARFLVALNYDIDTFKTMLREFRITDLDLEQGQLVLSFSIDLGGRLTEHHYQIEGFKQIINIETTRQTVNKTDLGPLNKPELAKAFEEDDLGAIKTLISTNLERFFGSDEHAIFKTTAENFGETFLQSINVSLFKTLGQIKLEFLLNLEAMAHQVLYLNGRLLKTNQLDVIISGFASKKILFQVKQTTFNDEAAYESLDNFVDNFVDFIEPGPENKQNRNHLKNQSRFAALATNLTRAEFNHVTNISFDRAEQYNIALVNIDYQLPNDARAQRVQIAINSIKTPIQYFITQKPFDASLYPEWKNKSVDDFGPEDVLNLIGFNNEPNQYKVLSVEASRALFAKVLLKNLTITRRANSVEVEMELMSTATQSVNKSFQVVNLNWRLRESTIWTIVGATGLGASIIGLVIILWMRRAYLKRHVMKVNNWNQFGEGGK